MPQGLPIPQVTEGSFDPNDNAFATTLFGLNGGPDHLWKFDESSGSVIDQGVSGTLHNMGTTGSIPWRRAPGVIRGVPREFGAWCQGNDFSTDGFPRWNINNPTDFDPAGWLTTSIGVAGVVFSLYQVHPIFTFTYDNNNGQFIEGWIETDGSIRIEVNRLGVINRAQSAAAVVVPGAPYLIVVSQRADGNGIQINHNGSNLAVTETLAGGAVSDDWADAILDVAGDLCTRLMVNGNNNVVSQETTFAIIQDPFIYKNSFLTDPEISTLFASANLAGPPRDFFDTVRDLCAGTEYMFFMPYVPHAVIDIEPFSNAGLPPVAQEGAFILTGNAPVPYSIVANSGVLGTGIVTDYDYHQISGVTTIGAISNTTQMGDFAGGNDKLPLGGVQTEGTLILIGTFGSFFGAPTKPILSIYSDTIGVDLKFVMVDGGGALRDLRVEVDDSFNKYVAEAAGLTIAGEPTIHMFAVRQDGGGAQMFLDGVPVTTVDIDISLANTSWLDIVVAGGIITGSSQIRWMADSDFLFNQQGVYGSSDVLAGIGCRKALSDAEMLQLWDSVNGTYV